MKVLFLVALVYIHTNGQDEVGSDLLDRDEVDQISCEKSKAFYACEQNVASFCTPNPEVHFCMKRCIFDHINLFNQSCLDSIDTEWEKIKVANGYRSISKPMASDLLKMLVPCKPATPHHREHRDDDREHRDGESTHRHHGHHHGGRHHNRDNDDDDEDREHEHGRFGEGGRYRYHGGEGEDDDDDDEYGHHGHWSGAFWLVVLCSCCCIGYFCHKKHKKARMERQIQQQPAVEVKAANLMPVATIVQEPVRPPPVNLTMGSILPNDPRPVIIHPNV